MLDTLLRGHESAVSPDYLGWLPEGAQEGATHAVAIGKTGLPGNDVDRRAKRGCGRLCNSVPYPGIQA